MPKTSNPEPDGVPVPDPVADDAVEMVKIPFRGVDFEIPKLMDEWDTDAAIALNTAGMSRRLDDLRDAVKLALGEQQWKALQALGTKRGDLKKFANALGVAVTEECVG